MKKLLLKQAALGAALLFAAQVKAQDTELKPFAPASSYRTWSFGIHGGVLASETLFGRYDFLEREANIGYGAFLKHQVLHGMGIRADFFRGKLEGQNSRDGLYPAFKTDIHYALSLNADINIATINWLHGKSKMIPYFSPGIGMMAYKPVVTRADGSLEVYKKTGNGTIGEIFFPVGLGLKFGLSNSVNLNLAYQANLLDGDNLDGETGDNQADKFGYGSLGLEFALGSKSKPQLVMSNPVKMMYDDYVAQNQSLKGELAAQKSAMDAALAAQKTATQQQIAELNAKLNAAIADADNDGVLDKLDKCPGTPAGVKVDGSGCPLPETKNVTTIITEEDRKVVSDAIANLEFDFGKSTIRQKSFPSLDRVARLLIDKNFSLKLAGHTDNVGSDAANLKLSKDRAESIKSYLTGKGANPSRIEATGYGESQPIATNSTDTGRQKNRRVEFTLY